METNSSFQLLHGDTMELLPKIEQQFEMIFADPPYFISGGGKTIRGKRVVVADFGDWDKTRPDEEKDEFNMRWLKSCRDRLKPNGTIWVSGTFHNIYSVARCLTDLGYKILNVITWQKIDPPPSLTGSRFNFSSEFIIWAAKSEKSKYYLNFELMKAINGGKQMSDVWRIPSVAFWEKKCGKHPTQKPLRLLYRIILACTHEGDTILDPFSGSGTTGVAATLLGRNFVGIDMDENYIQLAQRRYDELSDSKVAKYMMTKMSENPDEVQVIVNHARKDVREKMVETGICYMRAGESIGSLQVTPGFERVRYVLLHTGGVEAQLFHIKKGHEGRFQIWTKETLEKHGFHPEHAAYYIVIPFDNKPIDFPKDTKLKQRINTYLAKVRPLSDFMGIK